MANTSSTINHAVTVEVTTPVPLRFFDYDHLPPHLQEVSAPFAALALTIQARVKHLNPNEYNAFLRKLLEAKDCAVRAALTPQESPDNE